MIRVLLADSHQLLHLGIRAALSATHEITLIDAVADDCQLRRLCSKQQLDVVMLALNIADSLGTEIIYNIQQQCPTAKILLLLHSHDEIPLHHLHQFIEAGVAGAICKSDTPEKLIEAIKTVVDEHPWFSPSLMLQFLSQQNNGRSGNKLTDREIDVLQLIASGKADKEIAQALEIAERTVRYHLQNVNLKLGTTTRIEAVAKAIRQNIIQ